MPITIVTDPDTLRAVEEDSSHMPGGRAAGFLAARSRSEVEELLRSGVRVLPIGAQSSVTGGATPMGEVVLSLARMDRILAIGEHRVRVEAGVTVASLHDALSARGLLYPPAPTYTGATIGGTVATNAAGAATFKYGSTRQWVEAVTVVLPGGDVLEIARGDVQARDAVITLPTRRGPLRIPVPTYLLPDVPKRSAGYHAGAGMDLLDLFIGSEGTLGVVTDVTLRVVARAPAVCLALVPCREGAGALALVGALREAAHHTWHSGDPLGLDVAAIEQIDRRSIELLREDGADVKCGVRIPPASDTLLLVQVELPAGTTADDAYAAIGAADDSGADGPLVRFCRLLADYEALDDVEVAAPGEVHRAAQLIALREAVPAAVNHRVALAHATVDPRITKTAADMIVPFDRFGEMLAAYATAFERRGLDYAIWGHSSDGNVHPNVIPRSYADVQAGREAILELGREVARLGGCPLAEHGVGRSAIKQALLRGLYGDAGIDEMRAVKRAIDPGWTLAPGVLFEP